MRLPLALLLLLLPLVARSADRPLADCLDSDASPGCLLALAHKESQRITAPAPRYQALAKLLNAAAVTGVPLPAALAAGAGALGEGALDDAHRLDLLMGLHNYRRRHGGEPGKERLQALALYHHRAETTAGSARLGLMLVACGVGQWPTEIAEDWQPMADHGCTPGFLEETELRSDTDRLMGVLLAPIVFYRDDEAESFEAAIDRAHAAAAEMDAQMSDKPDDARAAWQQLKAGMYLLHGDSFLLGGDLLRGRLSAAAAYAAVLAGEEIAGTLLAEERAAVAGLLVRAEQGATAEQIVDETVRVIDDDRGRAQVPSFNRVGFLTALAELLAETAEQLFCPAPEADAAQV